MSLPSDISIVLIICLQIFHLLGLQPDSVALITQLLDASSSQNLPPPSFTITYQRKGTNLAQNKLYVKSIVMLLD